MAIIDGPGGTQADALQTIWDLAEGFAVLARNAATHPLYMGDARALHEISTRLRTRAESIGRVDLAEALDSAVQRLHQQIS